MAEEERVLAIDKETAREMPLVDLAYDILKETNKPYYYRDLMAEVARLRDMTPEEVNEVIARLYTEINVDGRFINIGNNVWGLKRWYPVDKTMDKAGSKQFIRKEVDWEDDDEDTDLYVDEELEEDDEFGEIAEEEDLDFTEDDLDDTFGVDDLDAEETDAFEDDDDDF
jgi:DNA-directed RNA polymerase subunit delta